MAKDETIRLRPSVLMEDSDTFAALRAVAGYAPVNPAYAVGDIQAAHGRMMEAQAAEVQAQAAFAAAKDAALKAEWTFHNLILGAKDQVVAQFGKDSNQVESLGLKKKSEYRRPSRTKATTDGK